MLLGKLSVEILVLIIELLDLRGILWCREVVIIISTHVRTYSLTLIGMPSAEETDRLERDNPIRG